MEASFFNLFTAASLGHKNARAYLALLLENGLIPSKEVILDNISSQFEYLSFLTDIKAFIKADDYTLREFKQEMNGKSLVNLYLSSLADLSGKPLSLAKDDTD